jgi:hypothetical protein
MGGVVAHLSFFQKNKSVRAILPAEKKGLAREKIGSIV